MYKGKESTIAHWDQKNNFPSLFISCDKTNKNLHLKALIRSSSSMYYIEIIKYNHSYKLRTLMSH